MQGMNKAMLIGRVEEPRFTTTGGRPRLALKVHTVESYVDATGSERESHAWHRVVVWGAYAESLAPLIVTGRRVMVEGRITHRSWDGKDGRRMHTTEIHANEVKLVDPRGDRSPTERDAA